MKAPLSLVSCLLAVLVAAPALAQGPDTVRPGRDPLPAGGLFHFTGTIRDVNEPGRALMIAADSLPAAEGTKPGTLPYVVPKAFSMDKYHEGDRVEGDLVLQGHLLKIFNLRVVTAAAGEKKPVSDSVMDTTKGVASPS